MTRHRCRHQAVRYGPLMAAVLLTTSLGISVARADVQNDIRAAYVALQQATLCENQDRSVRPEMLRFETTRLGELFRDQPEATLNAAWEAAEAELAASSFFTSSQATGGPARIRFLSNCRSLADGITTRIRDAERALRSGAPDMRGIVGSRPGT